MPSRGAAVTLLERGAIGAGSSYGNAGLIATGHAMVGVSLGRVTGQLIAQLACGEKPILDLTPSEAERF